MEDFFGEFVIFLAGHFSVPCFGDLREVGCVVLLILNFFLLLYLDCGFLVVFGDEERIKHRLLLAEDYWLF